MNRWKITTKTETGDFIAWADTKEAAKRLLDRQKRKGYQNCKIERIGD